MFMKTIILFTGAYKVKGAYKLLLQALRVLKVLINHYYRRLDAYSYDCSLDFVLLH